MSEREEFEAWYKPIYKPHSLLVKFRAGGYQCIQTQTAWMAWQAARSTPKQGEALQLGVSATEQGATICLMQPHPDGSVTVIHSGTYRLGDSTAHVCLAPSPSVKPPQPHQEPGWVSVKDHLPPAGTIVAVLCKEWGEVPITAYINGDDEWVDSDVLNIPTPTHWNRLPAAPKEPKP